MADRNMSMSRNVPANFSFVPSVGPADPFRLTLPFKGRRVTVYVGLDRIGKLLPMAEECFQAFDPANTPLGPYPDVETAALGLWRAFLFAAEEVARIRAGFPPTPTLEQRLPVHAGTLLIGRVDVWSDGLATAFDGTRKIPRDFPSAELAVKIIQAEHNGKAGLSSNSLN
jgi:hypothetical protein